MQEHIAYAMRNTEARESLVYFNSPFSLNDWTFIAIEWMLIVGMVLTVIHAVQYSKRNNSPAALYTLLAAFLYGLMMDILSYYTVENFWHGEFSVMFLYNRLPLYIALFYPTFMYHIYMTIRRYDFSPGIEAVSTGFFAGLTYLIFDNFGPQVGWWIWDRNDPTTWPYLSSVPLTSYGWFFLFTGAFAWLARKICWQWVEQGVSARKVYAGIAAIPVLTILVGTLLFIPYNLFAKNMEPWNRLPWDASLSSASLVYVLMFSAAALVFIFNFKRPAEPRDKLLMVFPLIYLAGHLYMYIAKLPLFFSVTSDGLTADGLAIGNLLAASMAIVASSAIVFLSHPVEQQSN